MCACVSGYLMYIYIHNTYVYIYSYIHLYVWLTSGKRLQNELERSTIGPLFMGKLS